MKFKGYLIFFILVGILPDLYICMLLPPLQDALLRALVCLPTAVVLISLAGIGLSWQYAESITLYSYIGFIFLLPKLNFAIISAIAYYLVGMGAQPAAWAGLIAAAGVSLFFITLIFFSTRHLTVTGRDILFDDLPEAFDGIRICHLADFHLGSFGKAAPYVKRVVSATMAQAPDLILFTGDLVNFESAEVETYVSKLRLLKAPLGVFSVRGNHDFMLHGQHNEEERLLDTEKLLKIERDKLGWRVLLNENVIIEKDGGKIAIAGVDNISANPFFKDMGGDLNKALEGLPKDIFKILLSHDPSLWRAKVLPETDVDLTLSGHTHGLKFKFAGLNPSLWRIPESNGLYTSEGRALFVSEGLGSAFAFRLSGFPHVEILTLKRNKTKT